METSTDVIRSISVEKVLLQRKAILEKFEQMQSLAEEIQALEAGVREMHPPQYGWCVRGRWHGLNYYEQDLVKIREAHTKAIDAAFWRYLMEQSGNLTYMDAKAKEDWRKSLEEGSFPYQRIDGRPVSDFSMVVLEYGLIWYGLAKIFLWIFTGKI